MTHREDYYEGFFGMVHMADRLKEANDSLRSLFGERYPSMSAPVKAVISERMAATGKDVLPAAIDLMQEAESKGNTVHVLWFMSAAVDLVIELNTENATQ